MIIEILFAVLSTVICYLLGSMPMAYILVKLTKGIDVRTVGSGNVGATNAARAAGGWAFWVVLAADGLKGFLPVFILMHYCAATGMPAVIVLFGASALILGHAFPIFLDFQGGKGVATGLGILLALAPLAVLIGVGVFLVVIAATRMISAGSICASLVTAIMVTILYDWVELWVFTWIIAAFVIIKHRSNIARIFSGTENKIKIKSK